MKKKISTTKCIWNIVMAISILYACSCGNPLKKRDGKITVKTSYKSLTKEYGYVEVDSMTTYVSKVLDLETGNAIEGEYTNDTSFVFTLMRSSTYMVFKNLPRKRGKVIVIDTLRVSYAITSYKSLYHLCTIGYLKPEIPYLKVLNRFICFRPGHNIMYFIVKGDTTLYKTVKVPFGEFKEHPKHVAYPYYFLQCEDTLHLLDTASLTPIDRLAGFKVIDFCDDNSNFVFFQDMGGYAIFDIRERKIVKDRRSNLKSNILMNNEEISRYTSYNNEYPLEGTNLIKVSFVSTEGREVECLLNETNMKHTSNVLYDEIVPFDDATVMGILKPQNAHNIVFADQQVKMIGTIGNASGSMYGLFSSGSFKYNGDVNLSTTGSIVTKEKDNYNFGLLISKKTGKETGDVYQVFTDGQKTKIR